MRILSFLLLAWVSVVNATLPSCDFGWGYSYDGSNALKAQTNKQYVCKQCPSGKFSPGGTSFCTSCDEALYILNITYQYVSVFGVMPELFDFTHYADWLNACSRSNCSSGETITNPKTYSCACSFGRVTEVSSGRLNCFPCDAGNSTFAANSTSCSQCPAGRYSRPGGECLFCNVTSSSAPGSTSCFQCPSGKVGSLSGNCVCAQGELSNGSCLVCDAGKQGDGNGSCQVCPDGSYRSLDMLYCQQCEFVGWFPNTDHTSCEQANDCSGGLFDHVSGICTCPAGTELAGSSCLPNAAGMRCFETLGDYDPITGKCTCTNEMVENNGRCVPAISGENTPSANDDCPLFTFRKECSTVFAWAMVAFFVAGAIGSYGRWRRRQQSIPLQVRNEENARLLRNSNQRP
jgi:hypothetical protein